MRPMLHRSSCHMVSDERDLDNREAVICQLADKGLKPRRGKRDVLLNSYSGILRSSALLLSVKRPASSA